MFGCEFGLLLGGAFGVGAGVELGLFGATGLEGDTLLFSAAAEILHNMHQCKISEVWETCDASAAWLVANVACANAGCSGTLLFAGKDRSQPHHPSHPTLPVGRFLTILTLLHAADTVIVHIFTHTDSAITLVALEGILPW